jgi:hypothetical protein
MKTGKGRTIVHDDYFHVFGYGIVVLDGRPVRINYKTYGGIKRSKLNLSNLPFGVEGYYDEELNRVFLFYLN